MPPKEGKKPKAKGGDDETTVMSYLEKMNRPYNVQILHDNLQGAIGKTALTKILQTLTDDGRVTCKEFGKQKLFWRNQETMEVADPSQIGELDKKIDSLQAELSSLKEESSSLADQLAAITSLPSNKEADDKIASLTATNAELASKLKAIKENNVVISDAEKKKVEKEYDATRLQWRKRKRMCKEVADQLCEASGKRYKELAEEVGIVVDEESGVSFDNDKTTRMKKGEL